MTAFDLDLSKYELGWNDEVEYAFDPVKGLNQGVVEQISWWKGEPKWMTDFRLRSLSLFDRKPMAEWFAQNMPDIDFQDIYYYLKPAGEQVDEWDELPEEMMRTYEKLGIPEAERKYLAGVTAQYESEVVYHKNREDLEAQEISLLRHGYCDARVPRSRQEVFRLSHSSRRQQVCGAELGRVVGWVIHLRSARCRV